jgi:23S rRNA (cytosine1962-C5)-methyltransferase
MNQRIFTQGWDDYQLLDAGNGQKLERWGQVLTIRPEVNAYFKPDQTLQQWRERADWAFVETSNQAGTWQALKHHAPS